MKNSDYFPLGLLFSRAGWNRFEVAEILAGEGGDMGAIRKLAQRMNIALEEEATIGQAVYAGQINALGLIGDILRWVMDSYCLEENADLMRKGFDWTAERSGAKDSEKLVNSFLHLFPPQRVLRGEIEEEAFLSGPLDPVPPNHAIPREIALLALWTSNPAAEPLRPLFEEGEWKATVPYSRIVEELETFFRDQPHLAELDATLFEVLRAPMEASPNSLEGQLAYILEQWGDFLPDDMKRRILLGRDLLREEEKLRAHGAGPAEVLRFDPKEMSGAGDYPQDERYSHDQDWMSNLVLIAKSAYVWLDQLSKKYRRHIHLLDQIPDEELDILARSGFTGLWLIGVWERSSASQRIKRIRGNPEALSSAYSLYDYVIASDLGGSQAYENLRGRAWERGVRLATDMVPNHVGLYSKWVIEHPDWFVQLPYSPYPNYGFNGENLSPDTRVGLFIEDGYWDGSDAAVTFKRVDHETGETRYIYHGNDGTHMPWNDTAQLDYLNPEVREAVIQTILHVARQFPIIRFDAAMTLAKKHYKRLWFPSPGGGGDIPSRSERGLSHEDFDRAMPVEFWREVVDRVAQEAPDTLLLAEAFWLMEGYFVRTLGMHRVYNSAFMNMLEMEENANYRTTIKNVLEFSPEILKRFVNFMNNPDEETAVAQFGKGDKYFGVAVMMSTLPGLPMFGHGQVEGWTEKYGMEYRRAYWDEPVDEDLVRRHEAEVFPLLHKRHLFSGSENFVLYDFFAPEGYVNENVFAYSNRAGGERGLVLYNNAYERAHGWIRTSTRINLGTQDETRLETKTLSEGLGLSGEENRYYIARESRTGLEFLFSGRGVSGQGLYAELSGYEFKVFLDFREIEDSDGSWGRLFERLAGNGVPDMERAYHRLRLEPLTNAFGEYFNATSVRSLSTLETGEKKSLWAVFEEPLTKLGETMAAFGLPKPDTQVLLGRVDDNLRALSEFEATAAQGEQVRDLGVAWAMLEPLGKSFEPEETSQSWIEGWELSESIGRCLEELGAGQEEAAEKVLLLDASIRFPDLLEGASSEETSRRLASLFGDDVAKRLLHVNCHEDVWWFGKEPMERLLDWMSRVRIVSRLSRGERADESDSTTLAAGGRNAEWILAASSESGYRMKETLERLSSQSMESDIREDPNS